MLFCVKASRSVPHVHSVSWLHELPGVGGVGGVAGAELSVRARCSDGVSGESGEVPSGGGPGWVVALSLSG